jgi:hypothetical protein
MPLGSIDDAIVAHRAWVARFQSSLKGLNTEKFDLSKARDDSACELGQWLRAPASSTVLSADLHRTISVLHQTFHEIAAQIAHQINQYESQETCQEYLLELDALSKELVQTLMIAKKKF